MPSYVFMLWYSFISNKYPKSYLSRRRRSTQCTLVLEVWVKVNYYLYKKIIRQWYKTFIGKWATQFNTSHYILSLLLEVSNGDFRHTNTVTLLLGITGRRLEVQLSWGEGTCKLQLQERKVKVRTHFSATNFKTYPFSFTATTLKFPRNTNYNCPHLLLSLSSWSGGLQDRVWMKKEVLVLHLHLHTIHFQVRCTSASVQTPHISCRKGLAYLHTYLLSNNSHLKLQPQANDWSGWEWKSYVIHHSHSCRILLKPRF